MSFRSWKRVASSVMDLAMDVIWVIEREMERCEMRDARCEMREDRMGSARDVREIDEVEERKMEGWESQQ
jgi:hypothetical protein